MMVASAGWLVRSFSNLRNTDAGFVAGSDLAAGLPVGTVKSRTARALAKLRAELEQP